MEEPSAQHTTWRVAEELLQDPARRKRLATFAHSRYGITADESEDLLQETALDLLRHESNVRKPDGYVFCVFKAKCARHIARRSATRKVFGSEDIADPPGKDTVEELDRMLVLRQGFEEISSRCRRILSAYFLEGLSLRETASDCALSPTSVFKLVSRCLGRLRRCLA
jgi:RNA polymerase sigma factor (sigma-70 family)